MSDLQKAQFVILCLLAALPIAYLYGRSVEQRESIKAYDSVVPRYEIHVRDVSRGY